MKLALATSDDAIEVSEVAFGREFNEALVHQVVTALLAKARGVGGISTQKQKSRSEKKGSNKKPWRQKGTGRARSGCIRSPIWRGGGVTFAAKPRDYSQKVNKKMYQGAMRSILSELIRQEKLVVVKEFSVDAPKTKKLVSKLNDIGLSSVLIVCNALDEHLYLAARNLPNVSVVEASRIDPVKLVKFEKVLMTVDAVRKFEEALG